MVVTSAIFWLLFAVCVVFIYNINYSLSAKMTYGLVYRPSSLLTASSNAHQSTIQSTTVLHADSGSSYVPNETKISSETYRAPIPSSTNDNGSSTVAPNSQPQNFSATPSPSGNFKYAKKDIPAWMVQNGVVSHQYQVYENDSDAEESAHRFKTNSNFHKKDGEHRKKDSKGSSGKKFKEKKNTSEGEKDYEKSQGDKKKSKHEGHKSYSRKEGSFKKHGGKSKKGSHGSSKKKKDYSTVKGYKNKYKMDKEDNIHEFWNDHHEKGEFIVYGEKKKSGNDSKKNRKKHKWKKKNKKGKKKKKKGKKAQKKGEKENSGYDEKKGSKHFYDNEKEYGHKQKLEFDDDQKKS